MARGADTRRRILAAAVTILGRDGPDGFSAAALAVEAGVSKATLFHHFRGLDEIPIAALEQLFVDTVDRPDRDALPLRPYLEALGADVFLIAREQRALLAAYFVFFTKGMFEPRLRARFADGAAALHETMARALVPRLAGWNPALDATALASLVAVALDGLGIHVLMMGDEPRLRRAWAAFVEMVERVAAPDQGP